MPLLAWATKLDAVTCTSLSVSTVSDPAHHACGTRTIRLSDTWYSWSETLIRSRKTGGVTEPYLFSRAVPGMRFPFYTAKPFIICCCSRERGVRHSLSGTSKKNRKQTAVAMTVDGFVQRVGFRRFVERVARQNRITGYVANRKEGTVSIFAQSESREDIEHFITEVKNAPSPISVERLDTKKATPKVGLTRFQIKVGEMAEEMMEGFGGMETQFSDYRQEFKEFADRTDQNFKSLDGDFNDYREEFKDYKEEFRGFAQRTDDNFHAMDTKYGEISQKLTQILDELRTENREAISSLNKSVEALIQAVYKLSPSPK
jgi:acylphosphatase